MIRGARGERTVEVDGEVFRVLFTNRALAEAEEELGRGILAFLQEFTDGNGGVKDVAIVLKAGLEAARRDAREGGKPVSIVKAYDAMDAIGFTTAARMVAEAISDVLSYSTDAGEEPDPNE